jgi:hypothetical protein
MAVDWERIPWRQLYRITAALVIVLCLFWFANTEPNFMLAIVGGAGFYAITQLIEATELLIESYIVPKKKHPKLPKTSE